MKMDNKKRGIIAMLCYVVLGAFLGVCVRLMGEIFDTFQQIFLRSLVGTIFGIILFRKYFDFSKFFVLSGKDRVLLILRPIFLVSGIGMYTYSVSITKLANVSLMFAFPTTGILGMLILREEITIKKILLVLLSCLGVGIVALSKSRGGFQIGTGEVVAFCATFFYSMSYICRKLMSDVLNDQELAITNAFLVSFYAIFISLFVRMEGLVVLNLVSPWIWTVVILAGLIYILLGYLLNVGLKNLDAVVVNNLMPLDIIFTSILGLALFQEKLEILEIFGGFMIVVSAILIKNIQNKKTGIKFGNNSNRRRIWRAPFCA